MHLFAASADGSQIFSSEAESGKDYFCLECRGLVRVRRAKGRQAHFFHLQRSNSCRQSNKSIEHLLVQLLIREQIGEEKCELECAFPEVGRIADVCWKEKKIIFEVQCSPISAEEVISRNADYKLAGFDVIWILHKRSFAGYRLTPCERVLWKFTHFYSDVNHVAEGGIFDFISVRDGVRRGLSMSSAYLDVSSLSLVNKEGRRSIPLWLQKQRFEWKYFFVNDCLYSVMMQVGIQKDLLCLEQYQKNLEVNRIFRKQPGIIKRFKMFIFALFRRVLEIHSA